MNNLIKNSKKKNQAHRSNACINTTINMGIYLFTYLLQFNGIKGTTCCFSENMYENN